MGKDYATPEQKLYASILDKGMKIGLLILVVTFSLYVFGVLTPKVPVEELSSLWGLSVSQYLHETGIETGWSWVQHLNEADLLNFLGIAFLSGITIVCYLAIVPGLVRNKDYAYVTLAIIEILVLLLAASGVLKSGH
jgi:hypothetical protein